MSIKGPILNKFLIVLILAAIFVASSRAWAIEIGEKAPEFALTDLNGRSVSLSQFQGKVVILDFFASWCPPCRQEVPDFIELQKTYGPRGFSMVGISLVNKQDAKDFVSKMGINYPVLIDDNKVSMIYGPVRSIPTTFVIDRDSRIAKVYIGYTSKDIFENDIKQLLSIGGEGSMNSEKPGIGGK